MLQNKCYKIIYTILFHLNKKDYIWILTFSVQFVIQM